MEVSQKKLITREEWESRLKDLHIRKEDMNKLVVNFLGAYRFDDAVKKFIEESGTKYKFPVQAIPRDILGGNIIDAWSSIQSQYSQICCEHPLLTFQMQQQLVIDHILHKEVKKAKEILKESLAPMAVSDPHAQKKVMELYRLLDFKNPHDHNCPLRELVNDSQLTETASVVQALLPEKDQEEEAKL